MDDDSEPTARHHLFIAGTGRAGTSFLVRFMADMGLDTHLQRHAREDWYEEANAGLEDLPIGAEPARLPYVIKTPWLSEFIDDVLARPEISVDAVIIPVRDLAEAATSRVVEELRRMHQSVPWLADFSHTSETWGASPGGVVFSLNPVDQGRLLAVWFHKLVQRLVQADIPVLFLDFPRLASDADYLFGKLQPLLPAAATLQQARDAHGRTADPAKIRVGAETRGAAAQRARTAVRPGVDYENQDSLDHIAIRREMTRMRNALAKAEQVSHAAAADAAQLRATTADIGQRLAASQAAQAGLAAELDALRASRSWRLTAGLRALGTAMRGTAGFTARRRGG